MVRQLSKWKLSFPYALINSEISLLQEGSMDSLYEPVPEQQAHQERSSGRADSFFSRSEESGRSHSTLFTVSETWVNNLLSIVYVESLP